MLQTASGKSAVEFAKPIDFILHDIKTTDDCWFYHVIDLPGYGTVSHPGAWDLRGRFKDYTGDVDFRSKTVLDIGTASGFLSFEAEKAGASQVYSFDAADQNMIEYLPYKGIRRNPNELEEIRRSYWLSHKALGSNARMIYGDVYKLQDHVPYVDIVVTGQILVHLERPVKALTQMAAAAKETLIITEGSFADERPLQVFIGGNGNYYSWYHLSVGFYREFMPIVGFELVSAEPKSYRCNHRHLEGDIEVWTMVAKRTGEFIPAMR